MKEANKAEFITDCKEYLSSVGLGSLRAYGRRIGVSNPTKKGKEELIDLIVAVLSGEMQPREQSRRGAPIKNDQIDPRVPEKIAGLKRAYLGEDPKAAPSDFVSELNAFRERNDQDVLILNDPQAEDMESQLVKGIFRGQAHIETQPKLLLPLGCKPADDPVVLPDSLARAYDLREGDIVSYRARESKDGRVAASILSINGLAVETGKPLTRVAFDARNALYPSARLRLFAQGKSESTEAKYLQWVLALAKGQRCCILSAPKTGKTELLYQTAKAAISAENSLQVVALLVGRSYEEVGRFRGLIPECEENLIYTTYEEDPERQIFVAELALNRAKRLAECGFDVLLLVDSLSALASAYNDTKESVGGKVLAGGLESKTLQYIKKYFGAARNLEGGGTLTMVGTVCEQTGNPADERIASELCALANAEIRLNESLAVARVYPAIGLRESRVTRGAYVSEEEERFDAYLRLQYLAKFGDEGLVALLEKSKTQREFVEGVIQTKTE